MIFAFRTQKKLQYPLYCQHLVEPLHIFWLKFSCQPIAILSSTAFQQLAKSGDFLSKLFPVQFVKLLLALGFFYNMCIIHKNKGKMPKHIHLVFISVPQCLFAIASGLLSFNHEIVTQFVIIMLWLNQCVIC